MPKSIYSIKIIFLFFFLLLSLIIQLSVSAQTIIATYGSITRPIKDYYGYNAANVVRIFGYDNSQLPSAVRTLNSGMLRYPAGAYVNWWDWKTGWFKNQSEMPAGVTLPGKYILDYSFDDRLEQYKKSIDATGAAPIFVLNMISSTLEDQVAMLYHAQCLNLPVKYIELGKEFYDDDPSILVKYPTAESYATDVLLWTNELLKHFPDAKVAFVSAYEYNNDPSPYSRRKSWNTRVTAQLALFGTQYPVASTAGAMYTFQGSANPGVGVAISTPAQVDNLMENGYKILDHLQSTELPHLTFAPEIWMTETNLMDNSIGVHGTWAHGLFSVLIDMRYLEETKIKCALLHNLIGDAIYSSLFDDTLGFCFGAGADGGNFIAPLPQGSNCEQYLTNALQKTASGNALAQMGAAMFNADEARKIAFNNAPNIPGTSYKTIYGWKFTNTSVTNSDQLIILNLSGTQHTLSIGSLSLGINLSYDQVSSSPYAPIQGDMTFSTSAISGSSVTLTPYSITRIYKSGISSLSAFATSDTICNGNGTSLHARGADTYTWSPPTGLSSTSGPDVDANPASTTTYTVTDNYGNTKQVTVTVASAITLSISGLPGGNICQGQTLNLTANGGTMYNWVPKTLTSNTNGSSVSIALQKSTIYTVYANNGNCYCGEYTFTINVGGEVNLGNDHLICSGTPDTLVTGNNISFSYQWTSSDGSLNSTAAQPVVSPLDTTTYYLQSTESGCTYYDTLVVNTMNCCTGTVSVINSNVDNLLDAVSAVCAACVQTGNTGIISNYSGDIFINGTLTMEKNLQFINCPNVRFNHAGKINILQNSKLTLDSNSVIRDCNNEMWQGVFVYDANSLVRLSNGSTIKNAETAIDCSIDSKLYLENANLIDNYKGVILHDYLKAFIGNIYGTNFSCSGNNALISPHAGERTNCHFLIQDIGSVKIGNTQQNPNTFSYFDYGVKADSVELIIQNCNFQNFINTSTDSTQLNGIALDILGTNEKVNILTIGGTGSNEKLSFSNGYQGINASAVVSLNIHGNSFDNLDKAIYTAQCSDPLLPVEINISQDSITNSNYGIGSYFNSNATININQNYIQTISDSSSIGIYVEDLLANTSADVTISENKIYNTGLWGIYLYQPCYAATVSENAIFITVPTASTTNSFGIKAFNADSINVFHNLVASIDTMNGYNETRGIFIQNSANSTISDNALYFLEKGINCYGSGMNPSRLKCNFLYSCKKGIALENNCSLGAQGDSAVNVPWNNQWQPAGYYDAGNPDGNFSVYTYNSDGNLSKFFTRSSFPYAILTSGATGTGSPVPSSTITGTGTVCLPPLNVGIDTPGSPVEPITFNLYPNPAEQELHVVFNNAENNASVIRIYNSSGEEIFSQPVNNLSELKINLNKFAAGIYIVELTFNDSGALRKKFSVIK